ncbi:MAG: type III pantothenate kinase [Nitrosomonas sp.]|nr:type III pantothenate kinase [Nitrosomonas sp.]
MMAELAGAMKNSRYLLAIDSGNTAIKWGLHDGLQWVASGTVLQSERGALRQHWLRLPPLAGVMVCNVAGKTVGDDLEALLDQFQACHQQWITAQVSQCGVYNGYAAPGQLGCDRWAALIAAWHHLRRGCLVVHAGTAMIIDVLSDTGEFRGGVILPGPKLMQQALVDRTNGIGMANAGKFQPLPDNTEDAVFSGMIQALTGAVEKMHALMPSGHDNLPPITLVSGGDAAIVCDHLHLPYQVMDNLVLEGLLVIAREQHDPE